MMKLRNNIQNNYSKNIISAKSKVNSISLISINNSGFTINYFLSINNISNLEVFYNGS